MSIVDLCSLWRWLPKQVRELWLLPRARYLWPILYKLSLVHPKLHHQASFMKNQQCCTSSRELSKDTQLKDTDGKMIRRVKTTARVGIRTNGHMILSSGLCSVAEPQQLPHRTKNLKMLCQIFFLSKFGSLRKWECLFVFVFVCLKFFCFCSLSFTTFC